MHPPTPRRVSGSVRSRTWHWQGTRGTARFHLGPRGAGGVMRRGIGISYPPAWSAGAPDSRRRRAGRHAAGWPHPAPPSPSDFRVAICHRSAVKKRRACLHAAGTVAAERPGWQWLPFVVCPGYSTPNLSRKFDKSWCHANASHSLHFPLSRTREGWCRFSVWCEILESLVSSTNKLGNSFFCAEILLSHLLE